ncbi:NAD(P)-binding protein [Lentithecium fluviatile CBS 122367]|uniref:NAD(P)-binding protein n=1 Tax=Lentithecium fluviatile CBS 122367 TaxID=1168545 RepID=A0A6G1IFZ7_9PLEO|nr:NAD(P)-binding protein [Lentithecium fluviatile CBS 122367]
MSTDFPVLTKTFHTSVYRSIDPKNLSVAGKTILITGGGRGIGKAIATAFAVAGARAIIILGRTASVLENAVKEISGAAKTAGHESIIRHFAADITDAEAISHVFKTIRDEFGNVDVVVNNAGGLHLGTIEDSDSSAYVKSFETNVKGTLHVMQSFLCFGLNRNAPGPATFINLSTVGIAMPTMPTWSAYVASKLAAFTMTAFLGAEVGDALRVFSIHPGRIATDMSSKAGIPTFDDVGTYFGNEFVLSNRTDADDVQDSPVRFACGSLLSQRQTFCRRGWWRVIGMLMSFWG